MFILERERERERKRERERERETVGGGRAEREGDRIPSRLQALRCQHRARCGAINHGRKDYDLSQSQTPN